MEEGWAELGIDTKCDVEQMFEWKVSFKRATPFQPDEALEMGRFGRDY